MGYASYQNSDNIVPYYAALVADTREDIQNLPTEYAPGSNCIVTEDSSVWMLNTEKVWVEI